MTNALATGPVRIEPLEGGQVVRVVLSGGKGNVVDRAMARALVRVAAEVGALRGTKAVCLEGDGAHFSFGASVEEHLPPHAESMIRGFHDALRAILGSPVVWLAAVRGRCLGGGLELASACHRVFAAPSSVLGQPEIALGVFAPAASVLLPDRVGRRAADDLCLTGRPVAAAEALALGLVDEVAEDPSAAALAWARTHLLPRSASSLRHAVRALREGRARRLLDDLAGVERLYLGSLAATKDAEEGLRAFLEKRPPRWRDE
jgi:cyclohexa-1,5-dienecarbonyl-CoA hydratase